MGMKAIQWRMAAIATLGLATGCVSVSKSMLDSSYMDDPYYQDEVGVFLQSDVPPQECSRVALLHASGTNNVSDGKIVDKLREEAGALGANAIHIQSAEDAGGVERALAAAFDTPSDKDWQALALYCPGVNSGGDS